MQRTSGRIILYYQKPNGNKSVVVFPMVYGLPDVSRWCKFKTPPLSLTTNNVCRLRIKKKRSVAGCQHIFSHGVVAPLITNMCIYKLYEIISLQWRTHSNRSIVIVLICNIRTYLYTSDKNVILIA
jgi:hypothetical protein